MFFTKAKMIFPTGKSKDEHVFAGFYAELPYHGEADAAMQITASAFYKLYINDHFVMYGPARAAHEHARVDTPDIRPFLREGINHIAVEVAGYCGHICLSGTGEPAFLIAQIDYNGTPALWTGSDAWKCGILPHKVLTDEAVAHGRFWREDYVLAPSTYAWRLNGEMAVPCAVEILDSSVTFLPRVAAFPDFSIIDLYGATYTSGIRKASMTDEINVEQADKESYLDFDFGTFYSGFIGLEFECDIPCTVTLMYQSKISREAGEFTLGFSGQTSYTRAFSRVQMSAGQNRLETFEAYAVRYLRLIVTGAEAYKVRRLYVRLCQIKNLNGGGFTCSDGEINRILRANRTSLLINTFDTFMDCATRERGSGWNDANYWIAPAAQMLLGDRSVERCYLENQIKDSIRKYCDLPYACYPASYRCVIHNWTIYILLQLHDYYIRSGDKTLLTEHVSGIRWLVESLNRYQNRFGLLENLDEIVYTSSYTTSQGTELNSVYNQPISTMTNFMFARAIGQLGQILDIPEWTAQAKKIEAVMWDVIAGIPDHEESGGFPPSSIRMDENGKPISAGYESEGCQYFWITYGYFNQKNLPLKLARIFDHMGPSPKEKFSHDLYYMKRLGYEGDFFARIQALSMYGKTEMMLHEIKEYGLWAMDRFAGLLGEGWDWFADNHHSFNVFFSYMLQKELLGTDTPDEVNKTIRIAPHTANLQWAKGHMTTNGGICSVHWINSETEFSVKVNVPTGYTVRFMVPASVTGRNRIYSVNGVICDMPKDGCMTFDSDFVFVSTCICE
ncbi:MAG: hypothetical protein IJW77_16645 [Clostridia bacterium]|nr:hypothetical protein [Clostridia bacterium]